ncbi:Uncharacterised protein [Mycobacteroides abscessus subsp. abscessus]|nr:Uncharacterised protein [Mycobacteroides abscessus subsp. abscessus]
MALRFVDYPLPLKLLIVGRSLELNVLTDTVDAAVLVAAGRRGELSKVSSTLGTAVALSAVVVGAASLAALPASEA